MGQRQYKQGIQREQGYLLPPSIEEYVDAENPVRAIDAYVESLDLEKLGFENKQGEESRGQPAYPPEGLLKLYLYGYLHRVRSSRRLEAECQRNLEAIWLMEGLRPGYKTIADFRKNNLKALKKVNQDFVQVCKELDLFGKELVGIDGSFFRGNVSKGRIYTADRLKRALKHIEEDIASYLKEMEQKDQEEEHGAEKKVEMAEKLAQLRARQEKRQAQLKQIESGEKDQIAEVDEDARLLRKDGSGTIAGYNVQTAVDQKHRLIVVAEAVQDRCDANQAAPMGQAAKAVLEVEQLTTVQDTGYYNSQQIKACLEQKITPYIPEPERDLIQKDGRFSRTAFHYDGQSDRYICPAGKELKPGKLGLRGGRRTRNFHSSVPICAQCALKKQCLAEKSPFRRIERWEYEEILEVHRQRMATEGKEKMRLRAALCEHPFGTLKQWCGWTHFLMRGLEKVRAELSLLMLAYNFKRVLTILGLTVFREYCARRALRVPA